MAAQQVIDAPPASAVAIHRLLVPLAVVGMTGLIHHDRARKNQHRVFAVLWDQCGGIDIDPVSGPLEDRTLAGACSVVHPPGSLRDWINNQALNRSGGELAAVPGSVARVVQESCNRPLSAMLQEQLKQESPDGSFLLVNDETFVIPAISERGCASKRLAELRWAVILPSRTSESTMRAGGFHSFFDKN